MMRHFEKRWGVVAALVVMLSFVFLSRDCASVTGDIKLSFSGYTNAPNNKSRFALFSVSNTAARDIRWWGDWVEVDGSPEQRAPVMNPALPSLLRHGPLLKAADGFTFAIGDPLQGETGKWRFVISFTRYSTGERYLDFAQRHNWPLPLKLGPVTLIDDQRILKSTNRVTVSSEWLRD
jgi:hypothetical protein